ncbi:MAG: hypothetical protein A2428_17200 [Bdellovibrionales bacterium RIFOXYC1_FULL_54_43]|nr:MAG: hypothetical protein A2428_17200 [Bdellovibrionales bacterium RIFOXYC1_FULL_54_43]OFZ83346.1 MAG: hypothetical protein A2603_06755 [Bdellovibrionales bacterium RIFOXYD1_FULL_55_31]
MGQGNIPFRYARSKVSGSRSPPKAKMPSFVAVQGFGKLSITIFIIRRRNISCTRALMIQDCLLNFKETL